MDSNIMRERMEQGKLYLPDDPDILRRQTTCLELLYDYNATRPGEASKRQELLRRMFAKIGANCYIEPPLHANWGGAHVHMGAFVYANFNLTLVDDADIFIGDHCMIGPNVTIATAAHPILPELRERNLQYNLPVHIGKNVWIGAGAILLPSVRVGDGTVIGAGSVVTKDLPSGVVAVGNPCRVLREIGQRDREFYYRDRPVDV